MDDFELTPPPDRGEARKPSKNDRIMAKSQMTIDRIEREIPNAFKGDAHAYMVSVYKDPEVPVEIRLKAATTAARFEKPTLASVRTEVSVTRPITEMTDDELIALATTDGCEIES